MAQRKDNVKTLLDERRILFGTQAPLSFQSRAPSLRVNGSGRSAWRGLPVSWRRLGWLNNSCGNC
jgi:hypothetical protein